MNAFPANPNPPETIKAPELVDVEAVVFVTAKPERDTIPEFGFTTNDVIVDKPNPEPLEALTAVIKNDAATDVGATATEDAAADGTACQLGTAPVPFEVKTKFVLPADNFAKEVPVDATKISPIVYELNPVPPYKEVITVPDQVPEVTMPLVKRTFEIFDVLVDGTFIVPPINALPANPNPPETIKAPEVVVVVAVVLETNKFEKLDAVVEGT
jgi:hypothetical protein